MTVNDSKEFFRTGGRGRRRRKGRLRRTGGKQKIAAGFEIKNKQKKAEINRSQFG
jgi:hypothetical protein